MADITQFTQAIENGKNAYADNRPTTSCFYYADTSLWYAWMTGYYHAMSDSFHTAGLKKLDAGS